MLVADCASQKSASRSPQEFRTTHLILPPDAITLCRMGTHFRRVWSLSVPNKLGLSGFRFLLDTRLLEGCAFCIDLCV
jgi:hypothetical protein